MVTGTLKLACIEWVHFLRAQSPGHTYVLYRQLNHHIAWGVSLGGIPGCPYVPLCPNAACFDSYTVTDNITSSGENVRRNECMSVLAHAMQDGGGPGLP